MQFQEKSSKEFWKGFWIEIYKQISERIPNSRKSSSDEIAKIIATKGFPKVFHQNLSNTTQPAKETNIHVEFRNYLKNY